MNKPELISIIQQDSGITNNQANLFLNSFFDAVIKTLKKEGKVTIAGLGTFSVSKRAAKNPQRGSSIRSKNVAKFKAAGSLQLKIGGGTDDTGPMRTKR